MTPRAKFWVPDIDEDENMLAKKSPPTMKDVAQASGVSIQTVSAVVNEKPGITQETRTRVLAAVERLGYRPYAVARSPAYAVNTNDCPGRFRHYQPLFCYDGQYSRRSRACFRL